VTVGHLDKQSLHRASVTETAPGPSDYEQYLLELINRARADPAGEAARYGIDLNEGLEPGTISSDPKQPLAPNTDLVNGARGHSQWMIDNDIFSHTGANGSSPGDRMTAAGYDFLPSWSWGENIAWYGQTLTAPPALSTTATLHQSLFVDAGVDGRGHRLNLMKSDFREVGPGIVFGDYSGYNAEMVTEDFAYTATPASASFLTGVVYDDHRVSRDSFYTPGEGFGGATITATRASDGAAFQTTTWSSGGYSLALPAGTYDLTASGGGLSANITVGSVPMGQSNVKVDFTEEHPLSPVYRFWSNSLNGHFYTISVAERDKLINRYSNVWTYEGPVYYAFASGQEPAGTIPVYRFWSDTLGGHFYTTSAGERDKLINKYASIWAYEGPVYSVYADDGQQPSETLPVFRFWSDTYRHHFYTISSAERDKLINKFSNVWTYELIAWYTYPYVS